MARSCVDKLTLAGIDLVYARPGSQPQRRRLAPSLARIADRDVHERLSSLISASRRQVIRSIVWTSRPQGQAEHPRPFIAEFTARPAIVNLGDVTRSPQQKPDRQSGLLVMSPQGFSEVVNIIRSESVSSHDGEMACEVDEQSQQFAVGERAASTPTSGSIGPAGLTMSALPLPGWVTCRPSRIRNRRLKLMLGSWPIPSPTSAACSDR